MLKLNLALVFFCAVLGLTGCETQGSLFYWGEYEKLLHQMYVKPGATDPVAQVDILNRDLQKAEAKDLKPAPGVYAHLGYMYAAMGDVSNAEAAFNAEIALYPESAVLLQGMMNRARSSQGARK